MSYQQVVVLIPSHSLEDFPTDLGDKHSESLLNSFAVAFHPLLLAETGLMPGWHRADEPTTDLDGSLIIVPTACDDQLPHGWVGQAREQGAVVVSGLHDREKMVEAALVGLESPDTDASEAAAESPDESDADLAGESAGPQDGDEPEQAPEPRVSADIVADFQSLGTCWILMELLTRHMHHFSSYDEVFFEKSVVSAAKDALKDDPSCFEESMKACFELLLEARERFFPVDCYLLDLCLLAPDMAGEKLDKLLKEDAPVNYLLRALDAQEMAKSHPDTVQLLKEAWDAGRADIAGGDLQELPSPLIPLECAILDLQRGRAAFREIFQREPTTWGRRRYGLSPMLPQLLQKFGFHSGLHFLLDDGIYPDREQSRMRWEACDSSSIDAYSRIPLAADSATTWLKFPERMAESMESDHVAALAMARWPETKCPFFEDLRRMQKYAPVLGRFVTFEEYFLQTDDHSGGGWHHDSKEYLSPFFVQAVARREACPITRFRDHVQRVTRFETAAWQTGLADALMGRPVDDQTAANLLTDLEKAGPDVYESGAEDSDAVVSTAEELLSRYESEAAAKMSRIIMHGADPQPGWLCINTLSFPRRVVVDLETGSESEASNAPDIAGPVKALQIDGTRRQALVEIPAAGYAWIPDGDGGDDPSKGLLAEDLRLQNEFFEVHVSDVTGGLQRLKGHGRSPNRLSQQLAFRFARELTVQKLVGEETIEEKTFYSEMRCQSVEVTCSGPSCGEIVTTGEIVDPSTQAVLSGFRQTFRVWRGRPLLELEIELIDVQKNPEGDPWGCYYGSRFAWNDGTAALSQSVCGAAQPVQMQRIETLDFIEIASDEARTTILPMGLPFHRKTGPRMIDSLLASEGESERRFRFVIAVDQSYPMQAARDVLTPVVPIRTTAGPPRAGQTGWFYHIDTRCVQVSRVMGLMSEPLTIDPPSDDSLEEEDSSTDRRPVELTQTEPPDGSGFALRLQETEGQYQGVNVEFFRAPSSARVRDFRGQTVVEIPIEGDGLRVDVSPFAIVDLEVRFD
jgi:alpha-mannosidase